MKKIYKSFLLAMIVGLSIFTMGLSSNPPSRSEMAPKYQKMSAKKLQARKDEGAVLTPKIKAKTAKNLIGKSFSFNSREFEYFPREGDGEYFLKLKPDQTFILVYNNAFKVRTMEEGGEDELYVQNFSGNYKVSKKKIKLFIQDYLAIGEDLDKIFPLKRINSLSLTPKSISLNSALYDQLPTDIQQKISPDQIRQLYNSYEYYRSVYSRGYAKRLANAGSYVLIKKGNTWQVQKPMIGERKHVKGSKRYYNSPDKYGYLHKYDHVYPIPDSVSEDLINKFRASGSY